MQMKFFQKQEQGAVISPALAVVTTVLMWPLLASIAGQAGGGLAVQQALVFYAQAEQEKLLTQSTKHLLQLRIPALHPVLSAVNLVIGHKPSVWPARQATFGMGHNAVFVLEVKERQQTLKKKLGNLLKLAASYVQGVVKHAPARRALV